MYIIDEYIVNIDNFIHLIRLKNSTNLNFIFELLFLNALKKSRKKSRKKDTIEKL